MGDDMKSDTPKIDAARRRWPDVYRALDEVTEIGRQLERENADLRARLEQAEARIEGPLWTHCVFDGNPPEEFDAWNLWIEACTARGVFSGVRIKALSPEAAK